MRYLTLILVLGGLITLSSCKKDLVPVDEYVGSWQAEDRLPSGSTTQLREYTFTVTRGATDNVVLFNGFAQITGSPLEATLSGFNFSIPEFDINITVGGQTEAGKFSASGSLTGNTMTYTYSLKGTSFEQNWSGTARK
jgi:hypothetical protein